MEAKPPVGTGSGYSLAGKQPFTERLTKAILFGSALATALTTLGILATLAYESYAFSRGVALGNLLLDGGWTPLSWNRQFGMWPLLVGTLLVSLVALTLAVPSGLLAATYLSEFAPERMRRLLKPSLEVLAGVPSIVFGYFALTLLTPALQQLIPGLAERNALSPALSIGIMLIPMIASLSEEALRAVPDGLRESAYGLGASKLATVFHVVLPSAARGVGASIVLALSRAMGETMVVAIAAGQHARVTFDVRSPSATLTGSIVHIQTAFAPAGSDAYHSMFVVGGALFLLTFVMNWTGRRLIRRSSRDGSVR